jgi:MOSC domain-containing protein YiiM
VAATARIVSVNVGLVRTVEWYGREVTTAIWKEPVDGAVALVGVNLVGDDQADRRVHGGPDKAVYAYSVEDYAWWAEQGVTVEPGTFGENLTTESVDLSRSRIGDRWTIGEVVLEVAQPRQPCFKLGIRMGDERFPERFEVAARPGAYLRILHEGAVAAGDAIAIEPAAAPSVGIAALATGDLDLDEVRLVAQDPRVPEGWRRSAQRALRGD